ncbi:group II truncated hemoglobin [Nocardioides dilutus]
MAQNVYDAAGGMPALVALAHAWHERCLADPVVSHAFSHGFHPDHTQRLAAYWAEALGGPASYTSSIQDQSTVVRMHSGNGPHDEMDRRAMACFVAALDDAGIPDDPRLRSALTDYFAWGIAELNHAYPSVDDVPDDLPLPSWSWDGPAR